ncbi:MAG: hypothetical protein HYZ02_02640 [Candidatus Levybacteria bacterium]|nr:hypothetical protein [Candidatus Levybacteria bacterium]
MSKRTLTLIIILVIVTGILVALAVTPQKTPAPVVVAPTPTPAAQTLLSFSPNPLLISSASASVDVAVDTGNNALTAVQLELSYDPTVITSIKLTPASFFPNPVVLLENIDAKNGKISYALGIAPIDNPQKGQGAVVTVSFATNLKAGQQTQISFLPKTLVSASQVAASVLKSASNLTILFQNPPPQATISP